MMGMSVCFDAVLDREIMLVSVLPDEGVDRMRLVCRRCHGNRFWKSLNLVVRCNSCSPSVSSTAPRFSGADRVHSS